MARLICCFFFLLSSLLIGFKAPTYHLWLVAIIVTEFPLVMVGTCALILIWGFKVYKYQLAGTLCGVFALLFFISTPLRAWCLSGQVTKSLQSVFPLTSVASSAFSFSTLLGLNARKEVAVKTLTYVKYPGLELKMDFYPAQLPGKRPCIIVIHGGSWKSGDNKQLPELNLELALDGYQVAALNYRLAPKYLNPLPVQDVQAAISYLKKNADILKIDTAKFVLLGRSAGAQIALLAAYTIKEEGIKGVVDFYGPADMVWGYSLPANPMVMDSRKVMEDYLGGKYESYPDRYEASSPINFVSENSPPTLIIHGKNDVLVAYEHSERLERKLNKYGVKNYFLSIPWATHGFDYTINGPSGQLSTFAVKHFLSNVTQ